VIVRLPGSSPISEEACLKLVALTHVSSGLLEVIWSHCKKTSRFDLACKVLEKALETVPLPKSDELEQRRRLVELYVGDAAMPEKAIDHVEALLRTNAGDKTARDAAQRLLSSREVGSRAAAALQQARRQSQPPPKM
jgi:hypothetical protein